MAELIIYRGVSELATVHIGNNTVYNGQLMGENKISATFESPTVIDFIIGDQIFHNGQYYRLNQIPELLKQSRNRFLYTATFEGREYTLYNKILQHLGAIEFTYHGTPATILQLIINNANEIDPGWSIGEVEDIEEAQLFSFNGDSCRSALTKLAEAFDLEYLFDGQVIFLKRSVGSVLPDLTLEYGKGKGLYSLTRQPAADSEVYTRVFGVGGAVNLPENYRNGLRNLSFEGGCVERNVEIYGVIEKSVSFPHIYPRRTATITSAPAVNEVIDTSLDFNLNSVIVDGQAKIVFKTGDLGGNEFEILSYDHATKKIKFDFNREDNGYTLPNAIVKPAIGDTYTLVGIEMPQSYIDAAEVELKDATIEFAEAYKNPNVAFGLNIDEKYIRDNSLVGAIGLGDRIRTVDAQMGVDKALRVQSISYPLANPSKITATINDKVSYTVTEKVIKQLKSQHHTIEVVAKTVDETSRDAAIKRREFQDKVFDPTDGYFDGGNLRPKTVEAIHLAVGTRPQDFSLSVIFKPNYLGNVAHAHWTAGKLVHNTIDDNGIRTWNLAAGNRTDLVNGTAYHIYARCVKNGTDGVIVLDSVERRTDDDPTYYYFLIGLLSSVINGARWPSLSYGSTEINGGFLTTGEVRSQDGQTTFNLDTGEISGRIKFLPAGGGALKWVSDVDQSALQANNLASQAMIDAFNAQQAANGAQAAANAAKGVTDNFTTIDGGLIFSNTIKLGGFGVDVAGITGVGDLPTSIRFWAGSTYANRASAPFRVDQSGKVWMSNAVISGEVNATSGTIGGFQITPDGFGLNGSAVKIIPDKGISVLNGGFLTIPVGASNDSETAGKYQMYIDEIGTGGTTPDPIVNLGDLRNVDVTGVANDYVMYYESSTGKYKFKAATFGGSPVDAYSKSEINAFFGGVTGITGYNKANWDAAHGWGNHAGLYLGVNGTAVNSAKWGGQTYSGANVSPDVMMAHNGSHWGYVYASDVKSWLGLGSAAYLNASIATVGGTVVQRDANGYVYVSYVNSVSGNSGQAVTSIVTKQQYGENFYYDSTPAQIRTFLGMPTGGDTLQSVTDRDNIVTSDNIPIAFRQNGGTGRFLLGFQNSVGSTRGTVGWVSSLDSMVIGNTSVYGLVLNQAGNVGIGTTNPTTLLDVRGNIKGGQFNLLYPDGNSYSGIRPNAAGLGIEYYSVITGGNVPIHTFTGYQGGITTNPLFQISNGGGVLMDNGTVRFTIEHGSASNTIFSTSSGFTAYRMLSFEASEYMFNSRKYGTGGIKIVDWSGSNGQSLYSYTDSGGAGWCSSTDGSNYRELIYLSRSGRSINFYTNAELKGNFHDWGLNVEGDINIRNQIRAKGWYQYGDGHAVEIGVSGPNGHLISYDRTASLYKPLYIQASKIIFDTGAVQIDTLKIPAKNSSGNLTGNYYEIYVEE